MRAHFLRRRGQLAFFVPLVRAGEFGYGQGGDVQIACGNVVFVYCGNRARYLQIHNVQGQAPLVEFGVEEFGYGFLVALEFLRVLICEFRFLVRLFQFVALCRSRGKFFRLRNGFLFAYGSFEFVFRLFQLGFLYGDFSRVRARFRRFVSSLGFFHRRGKRGYFGHGHNGFVRGHEFRRRFQRRFVSGLRQLVFRLDRLHLSLLFLYVGQDGVLALHGIVVRFYGVLRLVGRHVARAVVFVYRAYFKRGDYLRMLFTREVVKQEGRKVERRARDRKRAQHIEQIVSYRGVVKHVVVDGKTESFVNEGQEITGSNRYRGSYQRGDFQHEVHALARFQLYGVLYLRVQHGVVHQLQLVYKRIYI